MDLQQRIGGPKAAISQAYSPKAIHMVGRDGWPNALRVKVVASRPATMSRKHR